MCLNTFKSTPFVCGWGGGVVTEASVRARMHRCNFARTNIGSQRKNGQIEPVQRVRRRARMTMMQSLTFRAHLAEAFTHMVVRVDLDVVFGDTHPNVIYFDIYIYTCVQYSRRWWCDFI